MCRVRIKKDLGPRRRHVPTVALLLTACALALPNGAQAQLAPANEYGITFAHVHLNVTDRDVHTELWTALFAGVVVERGGFTAVRVPGALIFLTEDAPTVPSVGTAVDHIGLKVRDLAAVLREWRARGHSVDDEWMGGEGLPQAYVTLPDGLRLELTGDDALQVTAAMHHVHFYSRDAEGHVAWYADILGGAPRPRGTIRTTLDVPGSNLSFSDADAVRPTQGTAVDHVGFEVENMAAFVRMLERRGVELQIEPFHVESVETWVAFFVDPAGARIEITEGLDRF